MAQGIFTYGPLALRAIRKFEAIVRDELNKRDCVELLMPMVHPIEVAERDHVAMMMGLDVVGAVNDFHRGIIPVLLEP